MKKRTMICLISAAVLTVGVTLTGLAVTKHSAMENAVKTNLETETTTQTAVTEEITVKPIATTTREIKPLDPVDPDEEEATATVTLTPDTYEEIEVIEYTTEDANRLDEVVSSLEAEGIAVETLESYDTTERIIEEVIVVTQATEAPETLPPSEVYTETLSKEMEAQISEAIERQPWRKAYEEAVATDGILGGAPDFDRNIGKGGGEIGKIVDDNAIIVGC